MCCMLHLKAPVSQYQTSPVHSVTLDTDIHLVERRLSELSLSCLAVVNHAHLVGVVSRTDLLRVGRIAAHDRESRSGSAVDGRESSASIHASRIDSALGKRRVTSRARAFSKKVASDSRAEGSKRSASSTTSEVDPSAPSSPRHVGKRPVSIS